MILDWRASTRYRRNTYAAQWPASVRYVTASQITLGPDDGIWSLATRADTWVLTQRLDTWEISQK